MGGRPALPQVKVFWPAMCRWYAGRVGSYDAGSGQHTVLYKDGDVQALTLEREAVLWLDLPPVDAASAAAARCAAGGWGHSAEQVRSACARAPAGRR